MISYVTGTVDSVTGTSVVLDVSGVGIELTATSRCMASVTVGARSRIPASLIVREDNWSLFGFADADERACFQALQLAKGVGPKVAINLLATLTPAQLRAAVAAGDARALTVAPGIGQKGAERLVIDLRDRLGPAPAQAAGIAPPQQAAAGWRREVSLALVGLGWPGADANAAVARIEAEALPGGAACRSDGAPDVGALLRLALRSLDRATEAR